MNTKEKMRLDVKWATRQRLQYIEIMAFYAGVVTRSDVARAFGLSDPAATKDLKLYGDLAPGNLVYHHGVFGFVPAAGFAPAFADLSPAAVLPVIAANLAVANGPYGEALVYGLPTAALPLPARLPGAQTLAQITRAIHGRRKLRVAYRSLSGRDSQGARILEPHTLVNTGLRWHVRAYAEDSCDFRDFVLSRVMAAECLETPAESGEQYDDDWVETVSLRLAPHRGLDAVRRESLLLDYGASGDVVEISVRRALLGYVLQRLGVDTTVDHSLNPSAYQLMLLNRDEIEPFAAWAFSER
ncbi:helix-turn-helix transcriptional regulator [Thiobacillus sedimenti]|uniref:WYL domain-containing protein n=1 Tax=Thiobacillus sedimenti TaxID=3110231 RepID=A0ABZ1CHQ3_9PROT|nr:WYL domain-containing protein [Thiobacillus sp. SCUT-2]WRS38719.1 WYL domain-containing protein [Thiobacillus sp. SCUT-2]